MTNVHKYKKTNKRETKINQNVFCTHKKRKHTTRMKWERKRERRKNNRNNSHTVLFRKVSEFNKSHCSFYSVYLDNYIYISMYNGDGSSSPVEEQNNIWRNMNKKEYEGRLYLVQIVHQDVE